MPDDSHPPGAAIDSLPTPTPAPEPAALDLAVRRRLLRSLSSRGSTEAAALVIPGVLCWFYSRSAPAGPLWVWWAVFAALTLGALWLRRDFRRDASLPDSEAVPKWERIFQHAALAAGLCWVVPIALTLQGGTTEFRLFLCLVLCAVIASAATFLAPLPGIFWRFFLAIYLPLLVAMYWYFPQRWVYLVPLLLLYGATIARHALGGRRMVIQQVERERERQQPVSVRVLFEEAATVFSPDAAQRSLRLLLYLPRGRDAWVSADPALLRQMVFNLTQNALRYTQTGGVLLGLRARAGQWRIEVWDTGAGVAPEDRQRIYAPYFRGQPSWSQHADGHGLGLAVVARSAQLMGAGYGVESTPSRGSCFWLQLPMEGAGAPRAIDEIPSLRTVASLAASLCGRCLLVDDDPQVGAALRQLLQSWGLQVTVCATGAQAMATLGRGPVPDVVLCDQRLPAGESGFVVLQALLARCGHARGAMVSGEHDAPELLQAQDEGYLVFRKPLAPDVLHAVLARWLATPRAG